MSKAEVVLIEKEWDGAQCRNYYVAVIRFEEIPDIKLGEIEFK